MTRRRLAVSVLAVAAVLLAGRALSTAYAGYTWYVSLGARSLWIERATDSFLIQGGGFVVAALFIFANLAATLRSVRAVARPRRLANIEFLEQVQVPHLKWAVAILSIGSALVLTTLLPSWKSMALARLGVDFREADPYLTHDLSFYVSWLPLEAGVHAWAIVLVALVSVTVVSLYAFTGGVRWQQGLLQMTVRVRRHLGILAAVILLMFAWSYRLESYGLVSGPLASTFDSISHHWMLPALLGLGMVMLASAITVGLSAWAGQLRTSLIAIMIAIAVAAVVKEVVPFILRQSQTPEARVADMAPYRATRNAFTRRAFTGEFDATGAEDGVIAAQPAGANSSDTVVGPGAAGLIVLDNPTMDIAGPSLGRGVVRLAHAWAERDFSLFADSIRRRARIVTVRDVVSRVSKRYPLFFAGLAPQHLYRADTLFWAVPLYATSGSYPLAEPRRIAGESRSYFRRIGTAFVNARSARVWAAFDSPPDPIAAAWIQKFESPRTVYGGEALRGSLTASAPGAVAIPADTSFKSSVERLYDRMRTALASGDLRSFSLAYDSLGALVERGRKR